MANWTSTEWAAWIQAIAAIAQGVGAILVYIVTVRLVRLTKDMILAPVEPEIRLRIPTGGIDNEAQEQSKLINRGATDVVDLQIWCHAIIRYVGPTQPQSGEVGVRLDNVLAPATIERGKETSVHLFALTQRAMAVALNLSTDQRVTWRGIRLEIRRRQAITRKLFGFVERYQIHVWPDNKISLLPLDRVKLNADQMTDSI